MKKAVFVSPMARKSLFLSRMRLKPPKIIRRLMPDLIWEIDDEDGVFLTFDDGPTPGIT